MINPKGIGLAALLLALFTQSHAQLWIGAANQVTAGVVTIDGRLDESVWAGPEKTKIDQSKVGTGTVDNDADCYVQFATLWDATGWYLGVWFYDNIHAAMNSQYLDAANIAYDDDGLQLLVNYSFDDAFNSQATPYHGLYGKSLVKGFGNLDPALQYAGFWGATADGAPLSHNWTVEEQRALGWDNAFTSDDGLTYQYEAKFEWSGGLMTTCGTRNQGDAVGLNLVVNDNDGGFGIEGQMTLLPLSAGAQQWGKVVLSGTAGIVPVKSVAPISNRTYKNFSFDLLGRRIANVGSAPIAKNMLIVRNQQGKAIRSISR